MSCCTCMSRDVHVCLVMYDILDKTSSCCNNYGYVMYFTSFRVWYISIDIHVVAIMTEYVITCRERLTAYTMCC